MHPTGSIATLARGQPDFAKRADGRGLLWLLALALNVLALPIAALLPRLETHVYNRIAQHALDTAVKAAEGAAAEANLQDNELAERSIAAGCGSRFGCLR